MYLPDNYKISDKNRLIGITKLSLKARKELLKRKQEEEPEATLDDISTYVEGEILRVPLIPLKKAKNTLGETVLLCEAHEEQSKRIVEVPASILTFTEKGNATSQLEVFLRKQDLSDGKQATNWLKFVNNYVDNFKLPTWQAHDRTGWLANGRFDTFILNKTAITEAGIVDTIGFKDADNKYIVVEPRGNRNLSADALKDNYESNILAQLVISVALTAPLREPLKWNPIALNYHGPSSLGKTETVTLASALFGSPAEESGAYTVPSADVSKAGIKSLYARAYSLPLIVNESKDETGRLAEDLVFAMHQRSAALRAGQEGGTRTSDTPACSALIVTSESPIIADHIQVGAHTRILTIAFRRHKDDPDWALNNRQILLENYGYLGKEFIQFIIKYGFSKIKEEYIELAKDYRLKFRTHPIKARQAESFAMWVIVSRLIYRCWGWGDSEGKKLFDFLSAGEDQLEIQTEHDRLLEAIAAEITTNPSSYPTWDQLAQLESSTNRIFISGVSGRHAGRDCIYISPPVFLDILNKKRIGRGVLKTLADTDILATRIEGGKIKYTISAPRTIRHITSRMYCIYSDALNFAPVEEINVKL